jgi:hypothetical protein
MDGPASTRLSSSSSVTPVQRESDDENPDMCAVWSPQVFGMNAYLHRYVFVWTAEQKGKQRTSLGKSMQALHPFRAIHSSLTTQHRRIVQKPRAASRVHSHLNSARRYVPPSCCTAPSLSLSAHSPSRHHHSLIPCSSHAALRTTASFTLHPSHPQSFVITRHVSQTTNPHSLINSVNRARRRRPGQYLDHLRYSTYIQDPERRLPDSQRHGSVKLYNTPDCSTRATSIFHLRHLH